MKKLFIFLIGFLSAGILFAQDLKLEDILEKNFKAAGQDKLSSIMTIRLTMKMSAGDLDIPTTMFRKYPNRLRLDAEFQGTKMVYAFDGQNGWMINPAAGTLDPVDMPPEMVKDFDDKNSTFLNWNNPFFKWKEEGNTIELIGLEDMNGIQVYNIKITYTDNEVMNYYVDATKFVVLKEKNNETMLGQTVLNEDVYSNYREVEGIMVPFKIETFLNGQREQTLTTDKCEFNIPIDDALFTKPVPK